MNLLLLTNSMAPYRLPLFNHLAAHCELTVWFMREQLRRRDWPTYWDEIEFPFRVLPGRELHYSHRAMIVNMIPVRELRRYDCVMIGGWDTVSAAVTAQFCRFFHIPYVLWSGSTRESTQTSSGLINAYKRAVVAGASRYVSYGSAAARHLVSLGARPEAVTVGRNVGDTCFFASAKQARVEAGRHALFVGELSERLGADLLPRIADMSKLSEILVLGDGPLRAKLSVHPRIRCLGTVPRERVREHLGLSNVLLAPFRTAPFSISASEALAAGCPVVLSQFDGAADLVLSDLSNGAVARLEPLSEFTDAVDQVLNSATANACRDSVPADDYKVYSDRLLLAANQAKRHE